MATITEAATFAPVVELWATPMRPDNTPVVAGMPIGRVKWFSTFNTAAKITTNVVELAIACTVPLNYAYRLMNPNWTIFETDADAVNDIQDWTDVGSITVPTTEQTLIHSLCKSDTTFQQTITNLFGSSEYLPGPSSADSVHPNVRLQDPWLPLSPLIFRVVNTTANACGVMTWQSQMWAYMYTVEQYNQGGIWTANPIGND